MTLHSVRGADQVRDSRVSRSGRLATDQKAVRRRGPGRVVLGSKPQLATTEELVRWVQLVSWVKRGYGCLRPSALEVFLEEGEDLAPAIHRLLLAVGGAVVIEEAVAGA